MNRFIFSIFYQVGIHLLALVALPKVLLSWKKYRGTLAFRLGRDFPKIEKAGRPLIWVHAVSMGETKAVSPLIKKLKSHSSSPLVVLSTVTKTGLKEGKKSQADWSVYLPFDFSYVIRPLIKRICPDLVILTETDFWYNFQTAAKKRGAQLVVVNGKLSARSFRRYKKFPLAVRHLLQPVDSFLVQGSLYEKRLRKLNIPSEKIIVTGNIKLDAPIEISQKPTREHLGIADQFVITLGSTHSPEESIWVKALKRLWQMHPNIKVLLVPRHPERFASVASLLEEEHLSYALWSQNETLHARDILLVDTVGALKTCYQLSDLAFVGGSFTEHVGGHNILEPSFYGKPVLYGPHMHSQPDLLDLMRTYHAGLQIKPDEIVSIVSQFMSNPDFANHLGGNGLRLIAESRGALDKTFDFLQSLLEKKGA